jgi:hypothetical protein
MRVFHKKIYETLNFMFTRNNSCECIVEPTISVLTLLKYRLLPSVSIIEKHPPSAWLALSTKVLKTVAKIDTREFLAETNESQRWKYCRNMQIFISRNIFKVFCEFSKHYEVGWLGAEVIRKKTEYSSICLRLKNQGLILVEENINFHSGLP